MTFAFSVLNWRHKTHLEEECSRVGSLIVRMDSSIGHHIGRPHRHSHPSQSHHSPPSQSSLHSHSRRIGTNCSPLHRSVLVLLK